MPSEKGEYGEEELQELLNVLNVIISERKEEQYDLSPFPNMVKTIREAGWEPIVVTFPVFAMNADSEYSESFRKMLREFSNQNNVRWVDFSCECSSFDYWCDSAHLNRKGAEIIWQLLKESL